MIVGFESWLLVYDLGAKLLTLLIAEFTLVIISKLISISFIPHFKFYTPLQWGIKHRISVQSNVF